MHAIINLLTALAVVVDAAPNPMPQGVTQNIAPPMPAPAGCSPSRAGTFGISVVKPGSAPAGGASQMTDGQVTQIKDGQIQQIPDGQIQNPKASQIPDGQVQAPKASQIPDGQVQAPKASQIPDGQVQAPKASQIPDGQVQAPKASPPPPPPPPPPPAPKASQIPDGQVQAPKASQIPDGQVQAPKASQIPDGQVQAPKATQIPDGQVQAPKPPKEKRQAVPLQLTLADGVLKDAQGRTGYIAANYQFQFDKPAQTGAIYTAGWSVCNNGSLALGGSSTFYQCLSGDFYNLYDRKWAAQCDPINIQAV